MINGILYQIQNKLNEPVISIRQINSGYVNDVFQIQTTHTKYVLKIFIFSDKERINLSINLQKYLAAKKLAPEIITEGECGSYYVVQNYIDGQIVNKDWFQFGKTLGLIHYNLSLYDDSDLKEFSFIDNGSVSCSKALPKEYRELIFLKERIKQEVYVPEYECKKLIHGDYTWNNVLKKDIEYQVIDFDEAKKYFAIYDVAKVVFDLIFNELNPWENINKFIYGYQSICPICAYEKKEFLNIYAYTLMRDCSGLDNKNKDAHYLKKRIEKHRNVLKCFQEYNDIMRRLDW